MAHQSPGGGFGNAYPVSFEPKPEVATIKVDPPEKPDTLPSDVQPPGVDEDTEYESLEEALTGG